MFFFGNFVSVIPGLVPHISRKRFCADQNKNRENDKSSLESLFSNLTKTSLLFEFYCVS